MCVFLYSWSVFLIPRGIIWPYWKQKAGLDWSLDWFRRVLTVFFPTAHCNSYSPLKKCCDKQLFVNSIMIPQNNSSTAWLLHLWLVTHFMHDIIIKANFEMLGVITCIAQVLGRKMPTSMICMLNWETQWREQKWGNLLASWFAAYVLTDNHWLPNVWAQTDFDWEY